MSCEDIETGVLQSGKLLSVWLRLQSVWKAAACTGSQLEALLQRRVCMHAMHVVCVCAEQMIASANEGRVQSAYEWPANGKGGACVLL